MQRHGGFAGAGATLHDEDALRIGTDDTVLFGLDCRDDVAHLAVACLTHSGHQRALAREVEIVRLRSARV